MNILVVNPANKPFTNKSILAEPLDVLQIATIISKKFNIKLPNIYTNLEDVKIPGKGKRIYQLCKQVYSTKNK